MPKGIYRPSPLAKTERNREIMARWHAGESPGSIARYFQISRERVQDIIEKEWYRAKASGIRALRERERGKVDLWAPGRVA